MTLKPSQALRQILRHLNTPPKFSGAQVNWKTDRKAWATEVRNQFAQGKLETDPVKVEALRKEASHYAEMLNAMKEKLHLTVEWNASTKMTEKERVRATARRVGLSIRE